MAKQTHCFSGTNDIAELAHFCHHGEDIRLSYATRIARQRFFRCAQIGERDAAQSNRKPLEVYRIAREPQKRCGKLRCQISGTGRNFQGGDAKLGRGSAPPVVMVTSDAVRPTTERPKMSWL